jgi:hypothetical protein
MTFNEIQGGRSSHITPRNINKNALGNDLQWNAVANQNQEAGPITSYYIMHFVLQV